MHTIRCEVDVTFLQTAIEEFGQRLGMPSLSTGAGNIVALDVSDTGRLYLEICPKNGQKELLVYLARPVPLHDHDLVKRALAFCHYRHARTMPLWVGLHKDNLILLTRFNEREATGQALENAAVFLTDSLNSLFENKD